MYGAYDLDAVPMPTAEDFCRDARRFERWLNDEFLPANPIETWSRAACVNTIWISLGHHLRIGRGVIEFDKRRAIAGYLENGPPVVDREAFGRIEACLAGQDLSAPDVERLREAVRRLRPQMNACLGIRPRWKVRSLPVLTVWPLPHILAVSTIKQDGAAASCTWDVAAGRANVDEKERIQ